MKIKILAFVLIVTLLSISITKISVVNSKNYKPKTLFYTLCDEVQIEGDFFESSSEKMDGYSITVLNTEIISTNYTLIPWQLKKQSLHASAQSAHSDF